MVNSKWILWKQESKIIIEPDEEIDAGFSCLLKDKETGNIPVDLVNSIFRDFCSLDIYNIFIYL